MVDLSVESLEDDDLAWAEVVALSTPMHTALRLAQSAVGRIIDSGRRIPTVCFGLYAPLAAGLVDATFGGEYETGLVEWLDSPTPTNRVDVSIDSYLTPVRDGLPTLDRYAHLQIGDRHLRVGYVEASKGCRHRCRHCPVPVVYDGRYRQVAWQVVVEDVDQLVALGAGHISFGDPDFFNAPPHSLRTLEEVASRHPQLSYDVTIKVEHLLRHADLLPRLAELGVVFVVSAFESVDATTLRLLDKGHTPDDLEQVVPLVRRAGLDIHPTWMPFTPITTPEQVTEIFAFLDRHDLFEVTDPVQLSIRMLVPEGSLTLQVEEWAAHMGEYDPQTLTYRWVSVDHRSDRLQTELARLASRQADSGDDPIQVLLTMWRTSLAAASLPPDTARIGSEVIKGRPRLTEPWFC